MKKEGKRFPRKLKKVLKKIWIVHALLEEQRNPTPKSKMNTYDINRKFERFLGVSTSGFGDAEYTSGAS